MKKQYSFEKQIVRNEHGKQPAWQYIIIRRGRPVGIVNDERAALEIVHRCNQYVAKKIKNNDDSV